MSSQLFIKFVYITPPPTPLALDLYPGAAYAYSFRKLSNEYTGQCCRIRRSSDSTETDIGFVSGYVDSSAITAFCGGGSGYVVTWYDQSGNGVNKIQATGASQPIIVNAGTLTTYSGFVGMFSSGVTRDAGLYNTVSGGGATSQAFNVFKVNNNDETLPATNTHTAVSRFYGVMQPNGSSPTQSSGSPTYYKNGVVFVAPTRNDLYTAFEDTFSVLTTKDVDLSGWTESSSLYPSYRGIRGYNMEEIVYYDTTQDRALIEANQMTYYGIS